MSMRSLDLLLQLQALPAAEESPDATFADMIRRIREMDRDLFVTEVAIGAEFALEQIFDLHAASAELSRHTIERAHSLSSPNYEGTLGEHYQEMVDRGPESVSGFVSLLKGKVAEVKAEELLPDYFPGYQFGIAADPTQGVWDLQGFGQDGAQGILVQVKMGAREYSPEVMERMQDDPDVVFALSSELYDAVTQASPELADRMIDLGISNEILETSIEASLDALGSAAGFSAPAAIGEMLPYAAEIVLGIKLIYDMVSTERDFKAVKLADRSRVHALKALVLMSKFGVSTVCVAAGGMAGGAGGSLALPGIGTAAGGIIGGAGGAAIAALLNRRLRNRMLDLAMYLSGIDDDEFFYFRNKVAVDEIGRSMSTTSAL